MYVCIYVCSQGCMNMHLYVSICPQTCMSMCVGKYALVCVYPDMYTCTCAHTAEHRPTGFYILEFQHIGVIVFG